MTGTAIRFAAAASFLGFLQTGSVACAAGNSVSAGMGHDLAQRLCTNCHLIESGQSNPPDHVGGAAFQSIANRPELTEAGLRKHLRTTHSNNVIPLAMPSPGLTDDQSNKIVDYILSLKAAR